MSKMEDVLHAMVHDAMTLTDADVDATFESSRKSLEQIREEMGYPAYTEEDWSFIKNFYNLFYRAGFSDAFRRLITAIDSIADARQPENNVMYMTRPAVS